jgi:hypothetical protein
MYEQLQKQYSPYFGGSSSPIPTGYNKENWPQEQARKVQEFNQQKQSIEDWYSNALSQSGRTPTPFQYPGQQSSFNPSSPAAQPPSQAQAPDNNQPGYQYPNSDMDFLRQNGLLPNTPR